MWISAAFSIAAAIKQIDLQTEAEFRRLSADLRHWAGRPQGSVRASTFRRRQSAAADRAVSVAARHFRRSHQASGSARGARIRGTVAGPRRSAELPDPSDAARREGRGCGDRGDLLEGDDDRRGDRGPFGSRARGRPAFPAKTSRCVRGSRRRLRRASRRRPRRSDDAARSIREFEAFQRQAAVRLELHAEKHQRIAIDDLAFHADSRMRAKTAG